MSYGWNRHEEDDEVHDKVRDTECFIKLPNIDAFRCEQNDDRCPVHAEVLPALKYIDEKKGDAPHDHKYDSGQRNVVHGAPGLSFAEYSSIEEEDAQFGECNLHRLRNCDNEFDLAVVSEMR